MELQGPLCDSYGKKPYIHNINSVACFAIAPSFSSLLPQFLLEQLS